MTKIKNILLAVAAGTALAVAVAGPAAARDGNHHAAGNQHAVSADQDGNHDAAGTDQDGNQTAGADQDGNHADGAGHALTIIGPGTVCDAQGFVLIIPGDCADAPVVDVSGSGDPRTAGPDDVDGPGGSDTPTRR